MVCNETELNAIGRNKIEKHGVNNVEWAERGQKGMKCNDKG